MPQHVVDLPRALRTARCPFARLEHDRPRQLLQRRQPEVPPPRLASKAGTGGVDAVASGRQAVVRPRQP
eukprot:3092947-Alexandrium_andersonii.AAC.1